MKGMRRINVNKERWQTCWNAVSVYLLGAIISIGLTACSQRGSGCRICESSPVNDELRQVSPSEAVRKKHLQNSLVGIEEIADDIEVTVLNSKTLDQTDKDKIRSLLLRLKDSALRARNNSDVAE